MTKVQRFDLDLLRALAVIAVLFYHFKLYFPAGFIGVDIFFVLSGYLMAEAFKSTDSIFSFYERRFRRILPAMFFVLIIFYVASPILFLPFETKIFSDSVLGSVLLSPNIAFWRDNDYFSELAFTPFLHYWSLGVELQYYIVFPFMVLLLRRKIILIAVLLFVSLIVSVWMSSHSSKTAFFMLPTRIWEFLSGYVAWWVCNNKNIMPIILKKTIISKIAFMLLVGACFLPIPTAHYPGFYAIIPVLLSVIVIVFGMGIGERISLLVKSPIEFLAKISYSIYLIHFPLYFVFVYFPFNQQEEISLVVKLILILFTIILSYLSFKFVEMPFRNRSQISLKKFKKYMLGFVIILIGLFIVFKFCNYFINFYDDLDRPIINAMMDRGAWRCTKLQKLKEYGEDSCFLRKSEAPDKVFYLVGDSHIDALKEAFVETSRQHNVSIRLNRNRCYLGTLECGFDSIQQQIRKYQITDLVFHGYSYEYFDYENLNRIVDFALKKSIRIHMIGPVPVYEEKVPYALYMQRYYNKQLIKQLVLGDFQQSIASEYKKFKKDNEGRTGLYFYEPETLLCTPICQLGDGSSVYYFDSHHLTISGARKLNSLFYSILSHSTVSSTH